MNLLKFIVNKNCTYCSPVNEKSVEVQEHPSGLFGVGLLVEVSIEVAQLRKEID